MNDFSLDLNRRSIFLLDQLTDWIDLGKIAHQELESGAIVYDFGVRVPGGLLPGCFLARLLMADLAEVSIAAWNGGESSSSAVSVVTDMPLHACMGAQYAGWPIQADQFFAMGSGPMRGMRGQEKILEKYDLVGQSSTVFGGLECEKLPDDDVIEVIAEGCDIAFPSIVVGVAPVTSTAGAVQVVARSIETAMHKLDEIGFDLKQVRSAHGMAPLPPASTDTIQGIGRTNDAILYGADVTLWVEAEDEWLAEHGPKVPSCSSAAHGEPFAEIFRQHDNDFYKIDPGLFSPARISFINQKTGKRFVFGELRDDLLQRSFS